MSELTRRALEVAKAKGADYADIRVVEDRNESVNVKNGIVNALRSSESKGFGVRVLKDGAWGFASSSDLAMGEVEKVAAMAVAIAQASALVKRDKPFDWKAVPATHGTWKAPVEVDPFAVKMEDKIALLLEADRLMRQNKGVRVAEGSMGFLWEKTTFESSEKVYYEQEITESGGGISATAVDPAKGEMQRRSYPSSFGGQVRQ